MKRVLAPFLGTVLVLATMLYVSRYSSNASPTRGDLPQIFFLQKDSIQTELFTVLTENQPVVLVFFNSTCDHCQEFARELIMKKRLLQNVSIIMLSAESLKIVHDFYVSNSLSEIKNLVVGKDHLAKGQQLFGFESYPFCVVYNEKRQFIRSFQRNFNVDSLITSIQRGKRY